MPFKYWEPGEILYAADVNTYIMKQAVMIFTSASARDAGFTAASASPTEGMVAYIGSGSATFYNGSAWEAWPP